MSVVGAFLHTWKLGGTIVHWQLLEIYARVPVNVGVDHVWMYDADEEVGIFRSDKLQYFTGVAHCIRDGRAPDDWVRLFQAGSFAKLRRPCKPAMYSFGS